MIQPGLDGHLDEIQRGLLRGWAFDPACPAARTSLLISADGELLGRVLANQFRPHLLQAGHGDGRYGFELRIVPPLSPLRTHLLDIRREHDGLHVPGSPVLLAEAMRFDQSARGELAQLLVDADTLPELDERLDWLAWQAESLLQRRAALQATSCPHKVPRHSQARWGVATAASGSLVHTALVLAETAADAEAHAASDALHALGFNVSLAGADLQAPPSHLPAVAHHAPWMRSVEEILVRLSGHFDVVVLGGPALVVRYAGLLRHYQPEALVVLLLGRLDHETLAIQASDERAPELLGQASEVYARDMRAIGDADVTVTALNLQRLRALAPRARLVSDLASAVSPVRSDTG